MGDTFEKSFQYFSVIVPTIYPVEGTTDPIPGQSSPNSYLRLGDTPTTEDMCGLPEPGLDQRNVANGTPDWPSTLYKSFAPLNGALRVGAGDAIPFDESFYKNVGWLDHANGHRVTTTHGDKVEIITGNYKLVVMGRDGNPEGSTGFDMSGGHTVNWAKTPGCVRTITSEGGSFKVTHVTDSGHEYTIFEGFDTDHIVGGSTAISVMGGSNDRTAKGGGAMELVVDQAWSKKIVDADYADFIADVDAGTPPPGWPSLTETSDLKSNAAAFSTYPKSHGEVVALPKAGEIIEGRSASKVCEWLSVDTREEHVLASTSATEIIEAAKMDNTVTVTGNVTETWTCLNYAENFTGNRKNITNAFPGFETEYHFAGNRFDLVGVLSWEDIAFGINRTAVQTFAINTDLLLSGVRADLNHGGIVIEGNAFKIETTPMKIANKAVDLLLKKMGLDFSNLDIDLSDLDIHL